MICLQITYVWYIYICMYENIMWGTIWKPLTSSYSDSFSLLLMCLLWSLQSLQQSFVHAPFVKVFPTKFCATQYLCVTATAGSQLKTMHNMRLLCCDVLDLCRHSATFTGYVHTYSMHTVMSTVATCMGYVYMSVHA